MANLGDEKGAAAPERNATLLEPWQDRLRRMSDPFDPARDGMQAQRIRLAGASLGAADQELIELDPPSPPRQLIGSSLNTRVYTVTPGVDVAEGLEFQILSLQATNLSYLWAYLPQLDTWIPPMSLGWCWQTRPASQILAVRWRPPTGFVQPGTAGTGYLSIVATERDLEPMTGTILTPSLLLSGIQVPQQATVTGAATQISATITAPAGQRIYVSEWSVGGVGAFNAAPALVTLSGVTGGPLNLGQLQVPPGATAGTLGASLSGTFPTPIQGSVGGSITLTLAAFGNTSFATIFGFSLPW